MPRAAEPSAEAAGVIREEEIEIRPLRTHDEYLACVALQRATWGESFAETVPPTILKVSQRIGGLAAGAFDRAGALLGFVFGLSGIEDRRLVHWSDMLAVRAESRDRGLGRRLKEYQRAYVRELGVEVIYWSYDPLVARNAHLNLNRLGARIVEYVPEMYGDTSSELHAGLGTDRCVVAWHVAGEEARGERQRQWDAELVARAPVVNPAPGETHGLRATTASAVRIQIPRDIHAVTPLADAAAWRASTRAAFLGFLGRGYRVVGFRCEEGAPRCHYLLARGAAPEEAS